MCQHSCWHKEVAVSDDIITVKIINGILNIIRLPVNAERLPKREDHICGYDFKRRHVPDDIGSVI